MKTETQETPKSDPKTVEKLDWTPPKIKKLDIEETAISTGTNFDGDGFS